MNATPSKYHKYCKSARIPIKGVDPEWSCDTERILEEAANSSQTDQGGVFAVSRTGEAFEFTKIAERALNRLN